MGWLAGWLVFMARRPLQFITEEVKFDFKQ